MEDDTVRGIVTDRNLVVRAMTEVTSTCGARREASPTNKWKAKQVQRGVRLRRRRRPERQESFAASGGGISRPLRLRRRARSHVDEAGDRLETAVLRNDAEIRADKAHWRILRPARLPCEADAVVVCVHDAREAEAIGGKPLLDSLHHHVDTVVTIAAAMWIDVISSVGPSVGNEGAAAPRIPLVPSGEIAIDHLSDVTFSKRVHVNAPFVRGSTPARMIPRD